MKKILVIDDDADQRGFVRDALQLHGFEIVEAENSMEGSVRAAEHLPDLIICDVNMEAADSGYKLLVQLRESDATAGIPFILMTGKFDRDDDRTKIVRHGMELGADDYLPKPFSMAALYAAVDARLRKTATVREVAERKLAALRNNVYLSLPHEMLTPLNGIISSAEMLASSSATLGAGTIAEMGREISQSGRRFKRIIDNFLVYAQLELISTDPKRISALRSERTEHAAEVVRFASASQAGRFSRAADLTVDVADACPAMAKVYFKIIVTELVQNGFKFSNPGSAVRVSLAKKGGDVEFIVADSGRGMSPEQRQRIGAFSQFDRRIQVEDGVGLGLAISKKLTELHGGSFSIQSQTGQGTAVTVKLPLASETSSG